MQEGPFYAATPASGASPIVVTFVFILEISRILIRSGQLGSLALWGESQLAQRMGGCDTGTSGQRRSDGNIELVRFLDSHEGDGARAVFAGVQLLYKNNIPNDPPSKFAHR